MYVLRYLRKEFDAALCSVGAANCEEFGVWKTRHSHNLELSYEHVQ